MLCSWKEKLFWEGGGGQNVLIRRPQEKVIKNSRSYKKCLLNNNWVLQEPKTHSTVCLKHKVMSLCLKGPQWTLNHLRTALASSILPAPLAWKPFDKKETTNTPQGEFSNSVPLKAPSVQLHVSSSIVTNKSQDSLLDCPWITPRTAEQMSKTGIFFRRIPVPRVVWARKFWQCRC